MGAHHDGDEQAIREELLGLAERLQGPTPDPAAYEEFNQLASDTTARSYLLVCARTIVNIAALDSVRPSIGLGRAGLDPQVGHALSEAFAGINKMLTAIAEGSDDMARTALDYLDGEWPDQAEPPRERQKTALGVMLLFLGQRLAEGGNAGEGAASTASWN